MHSNVVYANEPAIVSKEVYGWSYRSRKTVCFRFYFGVRIGLVSSKRARQKIVGLIDSAPMPLLITLIKALLAITHTLVPNSRGNKSAANLRLTSNF